MNRKKMIECALFIALFIVFFVFYLFEGNDIPVSLLSSALLCLLCFSVLVFFRKRFRRKAEEKATKEFLKKDVINKNISGSIDVPKAERTVAVYKEPFTRISDIRSLKKYAIVDVETTGLSRTHDKIIEIGIVNINCGSIEDTYETTINPGMHISQEASMINGIYDKDVLNSPKTEDVIGKIWEKLSGRILVAYNASFDIEFISRALSECGISGEIHYIDALAVAKRAYPRLSNYKLSTVSKALEYEEDQQHRALSDVYMTYYVFEKSLQKILSGHEESLKSAKRQEEEEAKIRFQKFSKSPIVNKTVAFTGEFQTDREQLESMVEKVGGILKNSVVKKLDYLVVGKIENLPDWALERKIRKAERYISEGCQIKKISEGEYLNMIGSSLDALKK